jgi:hypothetical protein
MCVPLLWTVSRGRRKAWGVLLSSHDLPFPVHRLTGWEARPTNCGLPSVVHIRLFVAPFVDGLPTRQEERGLTAEILESLLNGE